MKPEKLKMQTADITEGNIEAIARLFPNVITERKDERGRVERAIDFDALRQELSKDIVEGPEERYQFTWPDKRQAIRLAASPVTAALRPCREESVDFDNTQNLYIEGDNLEVLKLLRETYLGKVKMIYIDPPYNTGNDFIYNDEFGMGNAEWKTVSGDYDEQGNRLVQNTESNGRFHTDWLNMIYPRLRLAKDLLSDDGVIFISIDDNEVENLRKCCDEVLGEENFEGMLIWQSATDNNPRQISTEHEYVLCYAKNFYKQGKWMIKSKKAKLIEQKYLELRGSSNDIDYIRTELRRWMKHNEAMLQGVMHYNNVDERGVYSSSQNSSNTKPGGYSFDIIHPLTQKPCAKPAFGWRWPEFTFWNYANKGEVEWGVDETTQPHIKKRIDTVTEQLKSIYYEDGRAATKNLENLFDGVRVFNNPKPINLIIRLMDFATSQCDPATDVTILDFFSGSSSTAHAVMQLNAEDGGKRKFIMVQLPEVCDEKSEAAKAGYKNICEIGKERIRRAGKKIKEANPLTTPNLDVGFRVLKLDSTNMKEVYYSPGETKQGDLFELTDNIKADRTPEDLLFQVMLELGAELSCRIETAVVAGKTVFKVDENYLVACFDEEVTDETVREIARLQPTYAVFRDSAFSSDSVAANFEQIFASLSPMTTRRVL